MIRQVMADFREPLCYMPWAFAIVLLVFVVCMVFSGGRQRQRTSVHFFRILFAVYALVVVRLAFFSREPGSREGVNWELLSTWGNSAVTHTFFVENILMLVPFGILAPLSFPRLRVWYRCVLLGGGMSVLLEFCQYVTGRGYCELDDMLTNTFGVLCGYCLLGLIGHLTETKKKQGGNE